MHDGSTEYQRLTLSNGALCNLPGLHPEDQVDASLVTSRSELTMLLKNPQDMLHRIENGHLRTQGKTELLKQFLLLLEQFDPMFNVVEP